MLFCFFFSYVQLFGLTNPNRVLQGNKMFWRYEFYSNEKTQGYWKRILFKEQQGRSVVEEYRMLFKFHSEILIDDLVFGSFLQKQQN